MSASAYQKAILIAILFIAVLFLLPLHKKDNDMQARQQGQKLQMNASKNNASAPLFFQQQAQDCTLYGAVEEAITGRRVYNFSQGNSSFLIIEAGIPLDDGYIVETNVSYGFMEVSSKSYFNANGVCSTAESIARNLSRCVSKYPTGTFCRNRLAGLNCSEGSAAVNGMNFDTLYCKSQQSSFNIMNNGILVDYKDKNIFVKLVDIEMGENHS